MFSLQLVQATLDKYGLHLDAKKVLRKISGKRPGKHCVGKSGKGSYISAEKKCADHRNSAGKLTEAGKASARELSAKVRKRKGMPDRNAVDTGKYAEAIGKLDKLIELGNPRKEPVVKLPNKSKVLSPHTTARLNSFKELVRDPEYGKDRAIKGLKGWKFQNSHRLTESDNEAISAQIDLHQGKDRNALKKQLVGLDDRIEAEQKATTARKTSATKARKQNIPPSQLNAGDRKQAVRYNEQGAQRAKAEGRSADAKAWQREAQKARISNVKSAQRQVNTTQSELFGIEEVTDLPLFKKRRDSDRWNAAVDRIEAKYGIHFDRAIAGGKTKTKSTRKKHNCSPKSQQCGTVCIPLTKECRDGSVGSAQERLKKLKRSGADDLQVQRAKTSIKARTTGKRSELAEKRIGVLRDRVKNSALSGARKAEGLAELDPNTIEVDPKRFQYKIIGEHTATGSVGSLAGVRKYDPNLAGILQVWKDPADGKTYVVNGHNRLDLGKKLGAESVAVRYLKAPDAKTARAIGALTNIAEGRGDALDAAKFFRDTGISKEDLSAKGIPMREKIATDGLALSKLDDLLFRRTIDGDIPMNRAAIVGGSGLDHTSQRDLMKLVDKEAKRKNLTDGAISEMVDIAKSSQASQEMTLSLFGEEMVTKSNMIEKAKLQASIKQRLSREKNLFGTVSRGRAADELARGGNTIDKSKSGEISASADRTLKQFDQMKNLSGPMSDAINRAATRMSNGESQKSVEKDLYAEISTIDIFGNSQRRAA